MKYIDVEKLIVEIEMRQKQLRMCCGDRAFSGKEKRDMVVAYEELDRLRAIITSLQQERGPHTESWIEDTKKELQHEEELLEMRLDTLKRIREKKNQFKQEQPEVDK